MESNRQDKNKRRKMMYSKLKEIGLSTREARDLKDSSIDTINEQLIMKGIKERVDLSCDYEARTLLQMQELVKKGEILPTDRFFRTKSNNYRKENPYVPELRKLIKQGLSNLGQSSDTIKRLMRQQEFRDLDVDRINIYLWNELKLPSIRLTCDYQARTVKQLEKLYKDELIYTLDKFKRL